MRARRASAGTERDRWARDSNSRRSSLFKISGALGRPVRMLPPYRARRIGLAICFSYFCYRTLGECLLCTLSHLFAYSYAVSFRFLLLAYRLLYMLLAI